MQLTKLVLNFFVLIQVSVFFLKLLYHLITNNVVVFVPYLIFFFIMHLYIFACADLTLFLSLSFSRQAYENCAVLEARICYNVAKLMYLMSERYQHFNYHSVCVFTVVSL